MNLIMLANIRGHTVVCLRAAVVLKFGSPEGEGRLCHVANVTPKMIFGVIQK